MNADEIECVTIQGRLAIVHGDTGTSSTQYSFSFSLHWQARWEPVISEYKQAGEEVPQSRTAARLLSTQGPKNGRELMDAANKFMATGP